MPYTVTGSGGVSSGTSGFSNSPYLWVDDTGGVSGAALAGYGLGALQLDASANFADSVVDSGVLSTFYSQFAVPNFTGSLALSSAFTLQAGDVLNVDFSVISDHIPFMVDAEGFGFAALVENGIVQALLGNVQADGTFNPYHGVLPDSALYPVPSAGVTTSMTTGTLSGVFDLGGTQYGAGGLAGTCTTTVGNCQTDVTTSYAPGAGTYQLLFGSYSGDGFATALAVKDVSVQAVPEPGTLMLLASGIVLFAGRWYLPGLRPALRVVWSRHR